MHKVVDPIRGYRVTIIRPVLEVCSYPKVPGGKNGGAFRILLFWCLGAI